jgi:hypothetical protein
VKSALQNAVLALTVLFSLVAAAWSQCNNPPSPGVVICTPTNGSTVVYNNEISIRSTPAPGASITGFSIYANKVLIYQSPQGQSGIALYDAAIQNGNHNLIVKAGDTAGSLHEAKTSFTVTGQGDEDCALPNSPGIDLCNPPAGAVYGMGVTAGASAKGLADQQDRLLPERQIRRQRPGDSDFGRPHSACATKHALHRTSGRT